MGKWKVSRSPIYQIRITLNGSQPTPSETNLANAVGFSKARQVGYDYDTLHRVTQAAYTLPGSPTTSFNYDLLGNRVTVDDQLNSLTQAYTHNLSNEYTSLVTNSVAQAYAYDVRGNLSRDGGLDTGTGADYLEYEYDIENRLTKVGCDPDGSSLTALAEYRYDGLGRRIEYIDHARGLTTRYYHDGQSIVAEYTYSQGVESPALPMLPTPVSPATRGWRYGSGLRTAAAGSDPASPTIGRNDDTAAPATDAANRQSCPGLQALLAPRHPSPVP